MKKELIRKNLKALAFGATAAGMSLTAFGLLCLSTMLFKWVAAVGGYMSVLLFFLALLASCATVAVVFICGLWISRRGRFEK